MLSLLLTASVLAVGGVQAEGVWEYTGVAHAPTHWKDDNPNCGGMRQSPVDIVATDVFEFPPFEFVNWDVQYNVSMQNNGHTVNVGLPKTPQLSGGGLEEDYVPAQFHFHWGVNSDIGSEHQLDGDRFPLELHIVHHRASYDSAGNALEHDGDAAGLAVLGVMFAISQNDNPAMDKIISNLKNVQHVDNVTTITDFSLDQLVPADVRNGPFFRYDGSLTTPPCSEVVAWTMFSNKIPISELQMEEFRKLHGVSMDITENWRPHQELNDRPIYGSHAALAPHLASLNAGSGTDATAAISSFFTVSLLIASLAL